MCVKRMRKLQSAKKNEICRQENSDVSIKQRFKVPWRERMPSAATDRWRCRLPSAVALAYENAAYKRSLPL